MSYLSLESGIIWTRSLQIGSDWSIQTTHATL